MYTFSVYEQEKAAVGLSAILPIYQKNIGIESREKKNKLVKERASNLSYLPSYTYSEVRISIQGSE